ncbi:uncharacterized protein METZ01_LOCUS230392 [marine metagenome]|uniref:Uncharacterized protein n=1 Tax=marine metagenome TaxID=408172 RepID=A0A382GR07_9ZZZZ
MDEPIPVRTALEQSDLAKTDLAGLGS